MRNRKIVALSIAILSVYVASQGTALAQTDKVISSATPATAPTTAKFSVDATPIEALIADPRAKAVVDKTLPGIENHPSYDQFKAMTLKDVAPYSEGAITPDKLTTIQAGLDQINQDAK